MLIKKKKKKESLSGLQITGGELVRFSTLGKLSILLYLYKEYIIQKYLYNLYKFNKNINDLYLYNSKIH